MKQAVAIVLSLVIVGTLQPRAAADSGSWSVDSSANWSVDGNWTGTTYPNGTSDDATLGSVITDDRTITLTENIAVNSITFDDDNQYTVDGANTLTLSDTTDAIVHNGTGNVVISADLEFSTANHTMSGSSTATQTWSGAVSYASGYLTKYCGTTVKLTGADPNTFGATVFTIGGGTVILDKPAGTDAFGIATANRTIRVGYTQPGALHWNASDQISDNASIKVDSTGQVEMNGYSDVIQGLQMNGGTVDTGGGLLSSSGLPAGQGGVVNGKLHMRTDLGAGALQVSDGYTLTINADISGHSAQINNASGATVILNGSNTLNGIEHYQGIVALGHDNAPGTGQYRFYSNSAGVTQEVVAVSGARVCTNQVRMTTNGNPLFGGTNALTFTGPLSIDVDMIVTVTNTAPVTFSGNVVSPVHPRALTKAGTGTLVLSGTSIDYRGDTTVTGGTLQLDGKLTQQSTSLIVTNTGALSGAGLIQRATSVVSNGSLAPGGPIGVLTFTNTTETCHLTLGPDTVLAFDLGAANDRVDVYGDLTLDGTLNVSDAGGFDVGTYRLFNYSGTLTDNTLEVGVLPLAHASIDTSTPGRVDLIVQYRGTLFRIR